MQELIKQFGLEKFQDILADMIDYTNNNSRAYHSLPLQFNEDFSVLKIYVTPIDSGSRLPSYFTEITFPKFKKSFWGISTGFYVSTIHPEAYTATNIPGTTSYKFVEEMPGEYELGISAMFRYGRKFKEAKSTFWHIGIGPGATITDKLKARIKLGGGLAFGRKSKFLIDAGIIAGQTDKLSEVYDESDVLDFQPTSFMVSHLKLGGYFSVGYLIFSK